MPLKAPHLLRWLGRNWFIVAVIAAALALGAVQLWVHLTFRPPWLIGGLISVAAIVLLLGFVWLLLALHSLRRPLADLRYRWLTRDVDRLMNDRHHPRNRPAAYPNAAPGRAGG